MFTKDFDKNEKSKADKNCNSSVSFADIEAFGEWIDSELEKLVRTHSEFQTVAAVRGHYGR